MPCLLWAELHEKLICGSKMMVKRNLHFSAPEDLVLWVNWRLFFGLFIIFFALFILFNSISTLSSHQILTNLRLNLIFGAGIGVLVRLWFFIDNEECTFSNVLLGLFYCRAKPGGYQVLILLLQNLLFQKFSRNTSEFPTGEICSKA